MQEDRSTSDLAVNRDLELQEVQLKPFSPDDNSSSSQNSGTGDRLLSEGDDFAGSIEFLRRQMHRRIVIFIGIILLALFIAVLIESILLATSGTSPPNPPNRSILPQPLYATSGAVAADQPKCSEMGANILKIGGNAVDAAVTTTLCQGLLQPASSGIGGGAVIIVHTSDGEDVVIDGREMAPAAAARDMFVHSPAAAQKGALACGVPGELKALHTAWSRWGRLPWKTLVRPVADLARSFRVGKYLAARLNDSLAREWIRTDRIAAEVYGKSGAPLRENDTCKHERLARTFDLIAENEIEPFYNGSIMQNLVQDIRSAGGILTEDDFRNYKVKIREPISTFYHGKKVISASAPFGGNLILSALNILERFDLRSIADDAQRAHLIVESWKFAFANRFGFGDPDFVNVSPLESAMLSKDHAAKLRQRISLNRTYEAKHYEDLVPLQMAGNDHGTSHLSVVDADGMCVALTTTVNLYFGSFFLSNSTGVLMNDEMDDFSIPGIPNAFDYPPSEANFIAGGKRPMSSMSPLIVLSDDRVAFTVGGSGGSYQTYDVIIRTMQTLINFLDRKMNVEEANRTPRFHCQLIPQVVLVEELLPAEIRNGLIARGHTLETVRFLTAVQAIAVAENGTISASSDWRKFGAPAGY